MSRNSSVPLPSPIIGGQVHSVMGVRFSSGDRRVGHLVLGVPGAPAGR